MTGDYGSVADELRMADILQLPTIAWNSDSKSPVTENVTGIPARLPAVVQARAEIDSQSGDTFTRQFSPSPSPPLTDAELAANAASQSQILPHLDLDRLQPKPTAEKRFYLRATLSVVVIAVAAIVYLFGQRSLAGGQRTVEWLAASIGVGQVSGSRTQQEVNGSSKDSGAVSPIVDVQSDRDRTDNNLRDSASMPSSGATAPPPNPQPDEAQRNVEGISTTLASVQTGTLPLQRAIADGAPDACGGKSSEGDSVPLPKLNGAEASAATYDPSEFLALAQIGRSWRPRMWLHWRWLNTPSRANKSHSGGESTTVSARAMNAASHSTN
jgi:hypothetical protein